MNHIGLFEGIGGFSLAARWMGWKTIAWCEINPFCQQVLKYHFPEAIGHGDITKTDFTIYRGQCDILTGGFPCQPYSIAGKRKGTEDDRHLWPEMLRAIREIKPTRIVGENVHGLLSWSEGVVFEQVCAEMEAEGYEVQTVVLPACGVDAPHRRDRVWIIAHYTGERCGEKRNGVKRSKKRNSRNGNERITSNDSSIGRGRKQSKTDKRKECITNNGEAIRNFYSSGDPQRDVANGTSERLQRSVKTNGSEGKKPDDELIIGRSGVWRNFPTQSPLRLRNDGLSRTLVRYITQEFYGTISEENRIENLPEVWERISSENVWEQIGGLYKIPSKEILFQTMQLYQTGSHAPDDLSPFSEKFSEPIMRKLRRYGKFGSTPQGQELEKQRTEQFGNTMSYLSHEIALAAGTYSTQLERFEAWHRIESIKGYGNSIIPQLAYQLFQSIEQVNNEIQKKKS